MAVVVTGAAGFLGRSLVALLGGRGEQVVAVDRRELDPAPGTVALRADLLDRDELVDAALADATAVYHLAGCPGVRDARRDAGRHRHRDNVLATARVLAAVPAATPVLVASSSAVYGGSVDGRASREDHPLRPRGGYARSKVTVEALCAARLAAGAPVAIARPFTVAGEGQRPDMAVARWIDAARAGRPLEVFGSLERTRDVTDVRQVVAVFVALVEAGARGPVNVGTGTAHRLADLVAAVRAVCDADVPVRLRPAGREEATDTRADVRRLRALTGWSPVTDLPALVARQASCQAALPVLAVA